MTWTRDMHGLAIALQVTKSRREAVELVRTWRAPLRPPPTPEPSFDDEPREDPPSKRRAAGGAGGEDD
jgi:hypothetical protein